MRLTSATDCVNGEQRRACAIASSASARRLLGPAEQPERVAEQRLADDADVVGEGRVGQALLRVAGEEALEAVPRLRQMAEERVGGRGGVEADQARLVVAGRLAQRQPLLRQVPRPLQPAAAGVEVPQAEVDAERHSSPSWPVRISMRSWTASTSGADSPRITPSDIAQQAAQPDLQAIAIGRRRHRVQGLEAVLQVADGFGVGRAAHRQLAGLEPALERLRVLLAGEVVMGDLFALRRVAGMASVLHRGGDPQVDLLALAPEQRVVGRVADQRVLERVAGLDAEAAPVDEAGLHQLAQLALERVDRVRGDRGEQLERERAADHRGELGDFLGGAQARQPRRQRVAERRRQLAPVARLAALEHRPGQLLDEQRHAVGLGDDVLLDAGGERRVAGQQLDQLLGVLAAERAERDLHDPGPRPPRDVEGVGPDRHHQQQRRGRRLIDQPFEPGQRRGVEPVQVLDQQDHRLAFGHRQHERDQRLERFLALAFGRHRRQGGRLGRLRQIEERGEQRQRLAQRERPQQGVEPIGRRLAGLAREQAAQQRDHRVQRRVLRVGRAVHRQPADRALARALDHPLPQRAQQPRLADAGLAAEQHRLADAAARLLPAVGELIELAGAADQRRQIEAEVVPCPARLADAVGHEGLGHAADRRQRRHRLGGEPAPHQRARRRADDDGARRGRRLQPQRDVERGAEHHRLRHVRARRDDGQAGVDADAERRLLLLARPWRRRGDPPPRRSGRARHGRRAGRRLRATADSRSRRARDGRRRCRPSPRGAAPPSAPAGAAASSARRASRSRTPATPRATGCRRRRPRSTAP